MYTLVVWADDRTACQGPMILNPLYRAFTPYTARSVVLIYDVQYAIRSFAPESVLFDCQRPTHDLVTLR